MNEAYAAALFEAVSALLARRPAWSHVRAVRDGARIVLVAREDDAREVEVVRVGVGDGYFTLSCLCAPGLWQAPSPWLGGDVADALAAVGPWAFTSTQRVRCPACGRDRALAEQGQLFAADAEAHRRAPQQFPRGAVLALARRRDWRQWACDVCLRERRAIAGDIARQAGMFEGPRVAYFAVERPCRDCGRPFVFTAERQRVWYEARGRYLGRHPTRCDECGGRHASRVQAMHALQAALVDLDGRDPAALVRVARLYAQAGSPAKAEMFLRRASNRARDTPQAQEIAAQVDALRVELGRED